jgi:hypothetical protein
MIQDESVDVIPRRDELGFWTISVDMTYMVEHSPADPLDPETGEPVPTVTGIEYTWELES